MPKPGPKPFECIRRAWHSEAHSALRVQMKRQMHRRLVIRMHKPDTVSSGIWQAQMPKVVMRIDEILYSKAKSQAEYEDQQTLPARLSEAVDIIIGRIEDASDPSTGSRQLPCIEASLVLCSQPVANPSGRSGRALAGSRGIFREIRPREQGQGSRQAGGATGQERAGIMPGAPSEQLSGSRLLQRASIDSRPFMVDPGGAHLASSGMPARSWLPNPGTQPARSGGMGGVQHAPPPRSGGQGMFPPPDRTSGPSLVPGSRVSGSLSASGSAPQFSGPSLMSGSRTNPMPGKAAASGGSSLMPENRAGAPNHLPGNTQEFRLPAPCGIRSSGQEHLAGSVGGAAMRSGGEMASRKGLGQPAAGLRKDAWPQPSGVEQEVPEEEGRRIPKEIPFLQAWQGSENSERSTPAGELQGTSEVGGAALNEQPSESGRELLPDGFLELGQKPSPGAQGHARVRQVEALQKEEAMGRPAKRQMQEASSKKGSASVERWCAVNLESAVQDREGLKPQVASSCSPFVPLGHAAPPFGFGLQADCPIPAKDELGVVLQFQYFMLLKHCVICTGTNGRCPDEAQCRQAKCLLSHLAHCNTEECGYAMCHVSKRLLGHHRTCAIERCPLCGPIRLSQLPIMLNK